MNKKILFTLVAILPLLMLVGCDSPSRSGEIDQVKVSINLAVNFPIEFPLSSTPIQPSAVYHNGVNSLRGSDTDKTVAVIPSGVVVDEVFDFNYQQLCRENNLDPDMLEEFILKEAILKFHNLPLESIKLLENLELCIQGKDGNNLVIGKVKQGQSDSEIELEIKRKNLKEFLNEDSLHLIIRNNGEEFTIVETSADLKLVISAKAAVYQK